MHKRWECLQEKVPSASQKVPQDPPTTPTTPT